MRDFQAKMDQHGNSLDHVRSGLESRVYELEGKIGNTRGTDVLREVEQRYNYMQEENKRARDIMESSIQEQIRLEHSTVHSQAVQIKEQWDREVKARQAYQENYKELLGQERVAREAIEVQIENRFQDFEKGVYAELQRVWSEIGKEAPPVVVQRVQKEMAPIVVQQQPQTIVRREVAPTQTYIMPPRVSTVAAPGYIGGGSIVTEVTGTGSFQAPPYVIPSPVSTVAVEYPGTRTMVRDVSGGLSYTAPAYGLF
jgi:hypothetical protein